MTTRNQVIVRGLRVRGRHGVLAAERRDGQDFIVDAVLQVDTVSAAASDRLADTVDYAALADRLAAVVSGQPVDLLETLAERLAAVCLLDRRVEVADITVHKPRAPLRVSAAEVAVRVVCRQLVETAIGLGANLGDRLAHMRRALTLLAAHDRLRVRAVSAVYESPAVGGPAEQGAYLNAVALVDSDLDPADLLGVLHVVEAACGRERHERWGPRTLDLDLLAVGATIRDGAALTLPHPRAHERAFVLAPWQDVAPAAELPGRGRIDALLAHLDRTTLRRRDDLEIVVPE